MSQIVKIVIVLISAMVLLLVGCLTVHTANKDRVIKTTNIIHANGIVEVRYEELDGDVCIEYKNY